MLRELNDYDWAEVFGEGSGGNCTPIIPDAHPAYTGSLATFSREDVGAIIKMVQGENDGADWVVYGWLKDGRYFVARGSCDYTGWDCRAGNSGNVAGSRGDIERFGLSDNERARFEIVLKGATQ